MDWINFIKDWGAHVLSALGILGGLWAYFIHDRKLKSQEKRLNEMQIRQIEKEETKELQADMKCNIIHGNKGNAKIRFVNAGKSDALNVRVQILTPKEELEAVIHDEQWGPYDMINPQFYQEERLCLCMGCPNSILVQVTWDDASQKNRSATLSVPL
ncbi:MAG: hypothetical protein HUJ97_03920 [Bacteroidales bacterium]|nr:hypothetical protein [Bacteroidales bacterium]